MRLPHEHQSWAIISKSSGTFPVWELWELQETAVPLQFPGRGPIPFTGNVVSISAGQIVFTDYAYGYAAGAFNGYVLTDLSEVPDFTSLTLVSVTGNALPITPGLSYTADSLAINFTPTGAANIPTESGTAVYTFDFTTARGFCA